MNNTAMNNARIWLSGAVPDYASPSEASAIQDFAHQFARQLFRDGGHLLHGHHPSLTPALMDAARTVSARGKRLTLVVSEHFITNGMMDEAELERLRKHAFVLLTPQIPTTDSGTDADTTEADSLALMRQTLVERSDALVAVGGRWWALDRAHAGVPAELDLAIARGLPCFIVGQYKGAAAGYLQQQPGLLKKLRNGWDETRNLDFMARAGGTALAGELVQQLQRLPLTVDHAPSGSTFRILALDGGGIKGVFPAAVLAKWEQDTGLSVCEHFDLIAGTSTGGIIALGLGLGMSARQILDFYVNNAETIFPPSGWFASRFNHATGPKYPTEPLQAALEAAFNQPGQAPTILGDARCRLVIPACHALSGEARVFRTPHADGLNMDANTAAVAVALATAAAPSYFRAAAIGNDGTRQLYLDGGVWANDPTMVAIAEALGPLGMPLARLDVLSLGTTTETYDGQAQTNSGLVGWARKFLPMFMQAQASGVARVSETLLGNSPRYLRVDQTLLPGVTALDDAASVPQLRDYALNVADHPPTRAQIQTRFLNGVHASPWQTTR